MKSRNEHTPIDPVIREAYDEAIQSVADMARIQVEVWSISAKRLTPIEQVVLYALLGRQPYSGITIEPQKRIGRYIADFVVNEELNWKQPVVVECDGHDFHERTKEQAQHDKRRDRELQALGFMVYRFTGSEIWKTRGRCVTEALEI